MTLEGNYRRWFQILVSIMVPTLLSLYFIKDVESVTIHGSFGHMISLWFLIPLFMICTVSMTAVVDREYPIRAFLIACTVIFIICYMGYNGWGSEYDPYSDNDVLIIDEEAAKQVAETGRYFGQFLVYVMISYVTMLIVMRKKWTSNKPNPPTLSIS